MSDPDGPAVTVCEDRAATEAAYAAAKETNSVYLAVEAAEDTWGVVYDLAPAEYQLDNATVTSLQEHVTNAVETHVKSGAEASEIGHSVGPEMGSLYGFATRTAATSVAEEIAAVLADSSPSAD